MHAPRSANPVDTHVGKKIRHRRKDLKMSQEKLGESLGITFQQVQKYEGGTNRVGASRLWKLSEVLEVPVTFFFDGISGGHQVGGFAENEQSPFSYDQPQPEDVKAIAETVSRIKSPVVRQQILDLAKSLADHQDTAGSDAGSDSDS